jgi:hypothetical protein
MRGVRRFLIPNFVTQHCTLDDTNIRKGLPATLESEECDCGRRLPVQSESTSVTIEIATYGAPIPFSLPFYSHHRPVPLMTLMSTTLRSPVATFLSTSHCSLIPVWQLFYSMSVHFIVPFSPDRRFSVSSDSRTKRINTRAVVTSSSASS